MRSGTVKIKFVMPVIDPDVSAPGLEDLVAFAEELTKEANAKVEEIAALEAEIARLKKAKQRKSRSRQ